MAWAAGTLVGPLWAAAVQKEAGWKTFTWTLGLLNAVSAIPVMLYSGGFIVRRKLHDDSARSEADNNVTARAWRCLDYGQFVVNERAA